MKQIFAVCLCILALLGAAVCADAGSEFENASALYEYWAERVGFPDYITGVWSSDGGRVNLTFGLTNDAAGRAGAAQILALVADDSTVSITYQAYGLNYLYRIQADVERYLTSDLGFQSVGVYFPANRVEVEIAQSRLDDPATMAAVDALTEAYGSAVCFTFTDTVIVPVLGGASSPANGLWGVGDRTDSQTQFLYAMAAFCVAAVAALLFSEYRRRRLLAYLTDTGAMTASRARSSYHTIQAAIQKTACAPSPETDRRIQETILEREL